MYVQIQLNPPGVVVFYKKKSKSYVLLKKKILTGIWKAEIKKKKIQGHSVSLINILINIGPFPKR